jgi:hypothetical protein
MIIKEEYEQYIESEKDVTHFLEHLKFSLRQASTKIQFQEKRQVDKDRDPKYTNTYAMAKLFPNDDKVVALKRELERLETTDYIDTEKDKNFPHRQDWRVFGKKYGNDEVYIKFRVELLPSTNVLVMSFHLSTVSFRTFKFPYK